MLKGLARIPASINQRSSFDNLADFSQLRTWPTYCVSIVVLVGVQSVKSMILISDLVFWLCSWSIQKLPIRMWFFRPLPFFFQKINCYGAYCPVSLTAHTSFFYFFFGLFLFFSPFASQPSNRYKESKQHRCQYKILVVQQFKSRCGGVHSASICF